MEGSMVGVERQLGGARVILCTLSMVANPRLGACGLTRLVRVQTVIVDEASQIELGDYLPLLHLFSSSLRKLVCIGDDKQCELECLCRDVRGSDIIGLVPPYGQEDIPDLKSVFEVPHLRSGEIFLDTQCTSAAHKPLRGLLTPRS